MEFFHCPQDLVDHTCINLRLPTYGGFYAWEFEKNGQELKARVEGQLVFNSVFHVLEAAVGLSPLLPEPSAVIFGLRIGGRSVALSGVTVARVNP